MADLQAIVWDEEQLAAALEREAGASAVGNVADYIEAIAQEVVDENGGVGGLLPGVITNIHVSPTAAIEQSKIAGLTTAIASLFTAVDAQIDPIELAAAVSAAIAALKTESDPLTQYRLKSAAVPAAEISGQLADAQIPDAIARDSEVTGAIAAHNSAFDHAKFISEDGSGKVPIGKLPDAVLGALRYQGVWAAATNVPAIAAATTANKGWYFVVSGSANAGHGFPNVPDRDLRAGDWLVSNGVGWDYVDSSDAVFSVNGLIGNVVLTPGLIGAQAASGNLDRYAALPLPNGSSRILAWDGTNLLATSGISAAFISSGTIADARIDPSITRDTEVPALARSALSASLPIVYNNSTGAFTFDGSGFATAVHSHAIAAVTGLQSALDAKQNTTTDLTNILTAATGAAIGQSVRKSSGGWEAFTPGAGGGAFSISSPSTAAGAVNLILNASTGTFNKLLALPFQGAIADSPIAFTQGIDTIDVTLRYSSATQDGVLSRANWATFNAKQNALGFTPLNPANNLSDLANSSTARSSLGLGSAATANTTAFATAAQGTLAGTALQPGAIGVSVQAFDADLSAIASLTTPATESILSESAAGVWSLRPTTDFAASTHGHGTATGAAAGFMASADKTKLDGIATGATANAIDAALRDRSTHTGTQSVSTITGLGTAATQPSTAFQAANTRLNAIVSQANPASLKYQVLNTDGTIGFNDFPSVDIATGTIGNLPNSRVTGLGTAALAASTSFATAAQGTLAGTALQPGAIGSTVQGYDSDLAAIATLSAPAAESVLVESAAGVWSFRPTADFTRLATGAQSGWMVAADFTKLSGIASGATANATDAQLRDRSSHTGTQSVGTITGLGSLATLAAVGTAQITDDAVTLAKLQNIATASFLGRVTEAAGDPEVLTVAQAQTLLGLGSAAYTPSTNYATASQGALAGTALQPGTAIANISGLQGAIDAKQNALGFAPLNPANSLSEISAPNRPTARTNLGLGTAAIANTGDFATAAQGTLASNALQSAAIGVSVQAFDADLTAIAGLATPAADSLLMETAAGGWSHKPIIDFAAAVHGHAIANVTGLQSALDGKQNTTADLTAILGAAAAAATGQSVRKASGGWEAFTPGAGGGGETNTMSTPSAIGASLFYQKLGADLQLRSLNSLIPALGFTANGDKVDVSIANASSTHAGLMSPLQKDNLDNAVLLSDINVLGGVQGYDSDLAAIASLATTTYGRSLLTTASLTADRIRLFGREVLNGGTKPTTRGDSTALADGDLWFDTNTDLWFRWTPGVGWASQEGFVDSFRQVLTVNVTHAIPHHFPLMSASIGVWAIDLTVLFSVSAAWTANTSYFQWQCGEYIIASTTGNGTQTNFGNATPTNISAAVNYRGKFTSTLNVLISNQNGGVQTLGTRIGTTAVMNSLGIYFNYRYYYK